MSSASHRRVALEKVCDGGIDLVVTNNFMPGMSGAQWIGSSVTGFRICRSFISTTPNPRSVLSSGSDEVVTLIEPLSPASLRRRSRGYWRAGGGSSF